MKRSEILFRVLITLVAIIGVIAFTVPQPILNEYELPYLLFVVIPLGALWLRAFIDGSNGN